MIFFFIEATGFANGVNGGDVVYNCFKFSVGVDTETNFADYDIAVDSPRNYCGVIVLHGIYCLNFKYILVYAQIKPLFFRSPNNFAQIFRFSAHKASHKAPA